MARTNPKKKVNAIPFLGQLHSCRLRCLQQNMQKLASIKFVGVECPPLCPSNHQPFEQSLGDTNFIGFGMEIEQLQMNNGA